MSRTNREMVEALVAEGIIRTDGVRAAMLKVDRALFVPEDALSHAYVDSPLGIGCGQTISAPHMVAIMQEAMEPPLGGKCLEIGTGSGYHASVIAEMLGPEGRVISVERHPELAERARKNIEAAGYGERVMVVLGDGSLGHPERAPYDRIIVTCAAPALPEPLSQQLAEGGRAVVPVGSRMWQTLYVFEKSKGRIVTSSRGSCVFVPLLGEHGFR